MRKASFAAGLLAVSFLPAPVWSAQAQCARPELEWETWLGHVERSNPAIRRYELAGNSRAEILRAYSCETLGGNCPPDHVMVFYCSGNERVLIAFVKKGCVTKAEDVTVKEFELLVTGGAPC